MAKFKIIPIFVPHVGCPHTCSFCNQRYITGETEQMDEKKAKNIIDTYLTTIDSQKFHVEVAFFGGSFTAIPMEYQNTLLDVVKPYIEKNLVDTIRISTRPDYINHEILTNLKKRHVGVIELGVQSMKDEILSANNRGHTAEDVVNACNLIKEYGFTLGVQQMPNLYLATDEDDIYTARELCKLKPFCVRIYPTLLFKNTHLHKLYLQGEYKPQSLEESVNLCKKLLEIYNQNNVKVIRLGLLVNDGEAKENFVCGPYHPRFSELVRYGIN